MRRILSTIVIVIWFIPITLHAAPPLKYINQKDGSEMVLILAGEFTYGIDTQERERFSKNQTKLGKNIIETEFPQKKVYLKSYYIDKYEITNEQYRKFVKETGYRQPRYWKNKRFNHSKQPVVGVGWEDAEAYAKWAGKRLPTEEEWEKAARGTDGRIWPWGNISNGSSFNGKTQGYYAPVKVGTYKSGASPYGVMDMAGNVYEMTTGTWGNGRAMRGGSYLNYGVFARTTFRWSPEDESNGASWLGFRCVLDSEKASN